MPKPAFRELIVNQRRRTVMDRTPADVQHPPDLPELLAMLEQSWDRALPAQRVAERNAGLRLLWRVLTRQPHAIATTPARFRPTKPTAAVS